MVGTVGQIKVTFQIPCMCGGGRAEASLAPLLQALDLGSSKPSSAHLNQWPLSVETVLICSIGKLLDSINRDLGRSNISVGMLYLAKGTLRDSDCGWCICSFCVFEVCLYAWWPPAANDVIFQGCVGQENQPLCPEMCETVRPGHREEPELTAKWSFPDVSNFGIEPATFCNQADAPLVQS